MFGAIVVGLVVSGLAAGGIVVRRAWSRRVPVRHVPPLIVMPGSATRAEATHSATPRPWAPAAPRNGNNGGSVAKPPPSQSRPPLGERVLFDDSRLADADAEPVRGANSETVRFLRPGEEPVQILPGRLEVLSGETKHREIMFVRAPGEPAELILGREPGHSPQTVALQSDTVSRRHARFTYSDGHWAVTNLSQTNPVVVNDERIVDSSMERPLADGDRVELGEVVLRFRSR
jgi:FHA domain